MKEITPAAWFSLLRKHAEPLRRAGVTKFKLDGVEVELAPPDQALPRGVFLDDPDMSDPLSDPATFGGAVPRFRKRPPQEEEFS